MIEIHNNELNFGQKIHQHTVFIKVTEMCVFVVFLSGCINSATHDSGTTPPPPSKKNPPHTYTHRPSSLVEQMLLLYFQLWNTDYIFTSFYFHTVKISKVLFSRCANNKRLCRHILYIRCLRYSGTKDNVINKKKLNVFFWHWI